MGDSILDFSEALLALDKCRADALFQETLKNCSPIEAVERLVVPALERIGEQWDSGSVALSQIYMSGRYCEELVDRVLPPSDPDRKHQPRQAIATLNDYHLLGKRIIYSVMRASGFEMLDYGHVGVSELREKVLADHIEILLISTLMLPSALQVKELRQQLDESGIKIKILVGGAPFRLDPQLWKEVGADAAGQSSGDAVAIVQRWCKEIA